MTDSPLVDAFLSHASPDKPWVENLHAHLGGHGYHDAKSIPPE